MQTNLDEHKTAAKQNAEIESGERPLIIPVAEATAFLGKRIVEAGRVRNFKRISERGE